MPEEKVPENKVRYRSMMSWRHAKEGVNNTRSPFDVRIRKYTKDPDPKGFQPDVKGTFDIMRSDNDTTLVTRAEYVFSELPSGCMQNEGELYAAWWTAHKPTRQEVIEQFSIYALNECRNAIEKELGRLKSLFDANAHARRKEFREKLMQTWQKIVDKKL